MTKASEALEARRRTQVFEEFKREWWWFDQANKQHIHEFSAAWEILRRTRAFRHLDDQMHRRFQSQQIDQHSFLGVIQKGKLMSAFREMLPQSPPAPSELCDMASTWQNMISNGWTHEKNYLEASQNSEAECVLPGGKAIRIPPTYGFLNRGIPVILPRQVASQGHTSVFVELCEIANASGQPPTFLHLDGSSAPIDTLAFMRKHGKPVTFTEKGRFIAVQFSLHHPTQAIKELLKTGLDRIALGKVWEKPPNRDGQYRGPKILMSTPNPLGAVAFFRADQPCNVIERGFRTLIRPERIKNVLPRIRKEWIQWECSERAKYAPSRPESEIKKDVRADWDKAARFGRLASQSTTRPIRPKEDLANLACAACAPFYNRSRADLPDALPERWENICLRSDADFNKRILTGCQLIKSQDDVFLPLLNLSATPLG
jgi:hypothetical protein